MKPEPRSRRRAVRLTPEALAELESALIRRWQDEENGRKLTREIRAELLGISIATVGRIFAGEGVDRTSLTASFKSVGLSWKDSYLAEPDIPVSPDDAVDALEEADRQLPRKSTESVSIPSATVFESPSFAEQETSHGDGEHSASVRSGKRHFAFGAALGGILLLTGALVWTFSSVPPTRYSPNILKEFDLAMEDGQNRFHRSDYGGARSAVDSALILARRLDSAAAFSDALRLKADVEAAQGRLPLARDHYREALSLRETFAQDLAMPVISESLAEVEMRMGENDRAKASLTRSLEGYRRFHDEVGVALATRALGSLAYRQGRLDEAERLFAESLRELDGLSKPDIVIDVRGRRALVLLKRGRPAESGAESRACLEYWRVKGHTRWIARLELQVALAEAALGHIGVASDLLIRSQAGFDRVGDRAGVQEVAETRKRMNAKDRVS